MLYLQPTSYGLDYYIQTAQYRMYNKLCDVWGVGERTYNCFGRVYRDNVVGGYLPHAFYQDQYIVGDGTNNIGMFFEDKLAAVSYFGLLDPIKQLPNGDSEAKLMLLFFLDLRKINPGGITDEQGQRLDDVCVNDVWNWFNTTKASNMQVTAVYKDVDKVLEKYSGEVKRSTLNKNMQPAFCFRIDINLVYNPQLEVSGTANPITMAQQWHSITLFIKDSPDLSVLIPVGNGKFIQKEYSAGSTLTPMLDGAGVGYLAGRLVQLPFGYNRSADQTPSYNPIFGTWTMDAPTQFVDGDTITITFLDDYGNWAVV